MQNSFYDISYGLLSHYLHFPDVADTFNSINDGLYYRDVFLQNVEAFWLKKDEIVWYIKKVRLNNIIDAYQEKENPFVLVPVPSGKLLSQASPKELYDNLTAEIPRLILKGIHQTIKHLNNIEDDNKLTAELFQLDTNVLQKYKL